MQVNQLFGFGQRCKINFFIKEKFKCFCCICCSKVIIKLQLVCVQMSHSLSKYTVYDTMCNQIFIGLCIACRCCQAHNTNANCSLNMFTYWKKLSTITLSRGCQSTSMIPSIYVTFSKRNYCFSLVEIKLLNPLIRSKQVKVRLSFLKFKPYTTAITNRQ